MSGTAVLVRLLGYIVRAIVFLLVLGGIHGSRWTGLLGLTGIIDRGMSAYDLRFWSSLMLWGGFEWWYEKARLKVQPMKIPFDDNSGYYRLCSGERDVCFATSSEKEKIPSPHRELYQPPVGTIVHVGKINCIIKENFWVWSEHCKHRFEPVSSDSLDEL